MRGGLAWLDDQCTHRYHQAFIACTEAERTALIEDIAWPKRAAGIPTDLDGNAVREYGLTHGRVDVKVCAIDDTWSGLKHVIRISDR